MVEFRALHSSAPDSVFKQAVRMATQYTSAPSSWQYLHIYLPGGTCSGILAI